MIFKLLVRLFHFIGAWMTLFDGLVWVATAGFYNPNLSLRFSFWGAKILLKKKD